MKKILLIIFGLILLTGCQIKRVDTQSIDDILSGILTQDNKLFNQAGQGYKYYLPQGVSYVDSDDLNDVLYSKGTYYYLYIDAINYYYQKDINYTEKNHLYYSKKINKNNNFKYSGYLEIENKDDLYYITFVYNYAKIEAVVTEEMVNETVLNSAYILSTIKYNSDIVDLMLKEDYFTNKTGKYDNYNTETSSEKFKLENEKEG